MVALALEKRRTNRFLNSVFFGKINVVQHSFWIDGGNLFYFQANTMDT